MDKQLKSLTMERRLKANKLTRKPDSEQAPEVSRVPDSRKKRRRLQHLAAKIAAVAVVVPG